VNWPLRIAVTLTLILMTSTLSGCVTVPQDREAYVRNQLAQRSQRGPVPIKIRDLENVLALLLRRELRADSLELGLEPIQVIDNGKPRESIRLLMIANVPDEAFTTEAVETAVRHATGVAGYRAEFFMLEDHRLSTWSLVALLEPMPPAIV